LFSGYILTEMSRVTGLGGHFLRARDPQALAAWYSRSLGLSFDEEQGLAAVLPDIGGAYSVFALFPSDSEYIGDPATQQAMVNLRVDDLGGLFARLDELGVAHEPVQDTEFGRFGWVTDPEGNRIELWQPK
jgi:catechol 2,3-dioxygenase-like lactoylglutathione lyase family enzyme